MNDDDDKMIHFISEMDDKDNKGRGENHYINATVRYTDISSGGGFNQNVNRENSSVEQSPNIFKYKDNSENLGGLSPFGGMRRDRTFS